MLFWRAKELFEGGGELLKAEAELAGARLRRALVGSFVVMLIVLLAFTGLLTLLAGAAIALAPMLGWGLALLSVGVSVMLLAGIVWAIHASVNRHASVQVAVGSIGEQQLAPEAEVAQAKERMAEAVDPDTNAESNASEDGADSISGLKDDAIEFAMRNPEIVGSVALLALSVIGPGRSLRLFSRGVATAGIVHSAIEALSEHTRNSEDTPETSTPRARQTAAATNGVAK